MIPARRTTSFGTAGLWTDCFGTSTSANGDTSIHQRIWTRGLCLRYQNNQSIHSSAMCRTTEAHDIFRTAQMPEASSLHN